MYTCRWARGSNPSRQNGTQSFRPLDHHGWVSANLLVTLEHDECSLGWRKGDNFYSPSRSVNPKSTPFPTLKCSYPSHSQESSIARHLALLPFPWTFYQDSSTRVFIYFVCVWLTWTKRTQVLLVISALLKEHKMTKKFHMWKSRLISASALQEHVAFQDFKRGEFIINHISWCA